MRSKNKYDVFNWIKKVIDSSKDTWQLSVADELIELFKEKFYFEINKNNSYKKSIKDEDHNMIQDLRYFSLHKEQSFITGRSNP